MDPLDEQPPETYELVRRESLGGVIRPPSAAPILRRREAAVLKARAWARSPVGRAVITGTTASVVSGVLAQLAARGPAPAPAPVVLLVPVTQVNITVVRPSDG